MNRILFFHSVDEKNINAQSINVKAILSHWQNNDFFAEAFYFDSPDPSLVNNPRLKLWKLPQNRLWKLRALSLSLRDYSAIFFPGLSAEFDHQFYQLRRTLKKRDTIITSLEGFPASDKNTSVMEKELSELAGHPVFCQSIGSKPMRAINALKSSSELIISISNLLERVSCHLWPDVRSTQIPLGVQSTIFNADGRRAHGENHRPRVVSAGTCGQRKRPELLVRLAQNNPDADFVWFGDGEHRTELLQRKSALGLENLDFPGAVDRLSLAHEFRNSDVFILPSTSEGVPKVTQEAAACGLPIVCMNYYEPFSVEHGVNGFQAIDDQSFFGFVRVLIESADLRKKLGKNSLEMASNWDWSDLAIDWQLAIIDTIVRQDSLS